MWILLNITQAASPLVRLVEGGESREAPDHVQHVFPQHWGGTEPNHTVTSLGLKATDDGRHFRNTNTNQARIKLNKLNAEIKRTIALLLRKNWIWIRHLNLPWNTGTFPRDWKKAIIVPIKNLEQNDGSPENYRPFALACIACNRMEKMVQKQLLYHPDSWDLVPKEQYGLGRGHFTIDTVLYLCQRIRGQITKQKIALLKTAEHSFDTVNCTE
ncbi:putative RNA-directed DNA polymerase from transposon BS [Trichonephila clavipes]|nr:putative RNA-directed DNA polymerase from transposon BS [Trichonephila clavipes]